MLQCSIGGRHVLALTMARAIAAPHGSEVAADANGTAHRKAGFWALTLGSLGVVYGDIGTSPLYALREAVVAAGGPGGVATESAVLGVLSLIIWALLLVVTAKYVLILLRLDNNVEVGTLALMALAQRAMGAVFLAVTGAEALYADLGHFGRKPIQTAWTGLVLPALAINYLGQGALVLADEKALENPFFLLYPDWAQLPMVLLATAATVIASQAVITGAYSLTRQAIGLGLLPRLEVRHTSEA